LNVAWVWVQWLGELVRHFSFSSVFVKAPAFCENVFDGERRTETAANWGGVFSLHKVLPVLVCMFKFILLRLICILYIGIRIQKKMDPASLLNRVSPNRVAAVRTLVENIVIPRTAFSKLWSSKFVTHLYRKSNYDLHK